MASEDRDWLFWALKQIDADTRRSSDTHLLRVPAPNHPGIDIYLKDESTHPSGSLKHRLARSLFLYALCNGWIGPSATVTESSSGSTAVSEAYFAQLLGLRFIAVMPESTACSKIEAIRFYGGDAHFVERATDATPTAAKLAKELGGHFMDQFTYAERATDWRANNNIAESLFQQMTAERFPEPTWIVCGAGTGGTSATLGRFARYHRHATRICIADPVGSVFHQHYHDRSVCATEACGSVIEGIGRATLEASFLPDVIDRAIPVADADSIAAARVISRVIGKPCGGSTGTNIWAVMQIAREMEAAGETGSIVSILCDQGDRYRDTYFDDDWVRDKGFDLGSATQAAEAFFGFV